MSTFFSCREQFWFIGGLVDHRIYWAWPQVFGRLSACYGRQDASITAKSPFAMFLESFAMGFASLKKQVWDMVHPVFPWKWHLDLASQPPVEVHSPRHIMNDFLGNYSFQLYKKFSQALIDLSKSVCWGWFTNFLPVFLWPPPLQTRPYSGFMWGMMYIEIQTIGCFSAWGTVYLPMIHLSAHLENS